jgi:hypothetical protein
MNTFLAIGVYVAVSLLFRTHANWQRRRLEAWAVAGGHADVDVSADSAPVALLEVFWNVALGAFFWGRLPVWVTIGFGWAALVAAWNWRQVLGRLLRGEAIAARLETKLQSAGWTATPGIATEPTGDPAFDATVVLGGRRTAALQRLDAPRRAALVRFVRAGGSLEPDGIARITVPGAFVSRAEVDAALAELDRFVEAFDGSLHSLATLAVTDPEPGVRLQLARRITEEPGDRGRQDAERILRRGGVDRTDAACLDTVAHGPPELAVAALRWLRDEATDPLQALQALPDRDGLDDLVDATRARLRASAGPEVAGRVGVADTGQLTEARSPGGLQLPPRDPAR